MIRFVNPVAFPATISFGWFRRYFGATDYIHYFHILCELMLGMEGGEGGPGGGEFAGTEAGDVGAACGGDIEAVDGLGGVGGGGEACPVAAVDDALGAPLECAVFVDEGKCEHRYYHFGLLGPRCAGPLRHGLGEHAYDALRTSDSLRAAELYKLRGEPGHRLHIVSRVEHIYRAVNQFHKALALSQRLRASTLADHSGKLRRGIASGGLMQRRCVGSLGKPEDRRHVFQLCRMGELTVVDFKALGPVSRRPARQLRHDPALKVAREVLAPVGNAGLDAPGTLAVEPLQVVDRQLAQRTLHNRPVGHVKELVGRGDHTPALQLRLDPAESGAAFPGCLRVVAPHDSRGISPCFGQQTVESSQLAGRRRCLNLVVKYPLRYHGSHRSVNLLKQVGMDKRQHNQADTLYLYDHVLILPHSLHVAFIPPVRAVDYSHMLVFPEILFVENLTSGCVVGRQKPQKINRALRYHLYLVVGRIAVNPERDSRLRVLPALSLEAQGIVARGPYKQYTWDDGPLPLVATVYGYQFFREKHFIAKRGQSLLGSEILTCLYGKPLRCFSLLSSVSVHIKLYHIYLHNNRLAASLRIIHNRPLAFASDLRDEPIQELSLWFRRTNHPSARAFPTTLS